MMDGWWYRESARETSVLDMLRMDGRGSEGWRDWFEGVESDAWILRDVWKRWRWVRISSMCWMVVIFSFWMSALPHCSSQSRGVIRLLGLHAVAVFMVDTATVWVCRIRPVMRNIFTMTGWLTVWNSGIRVVWLRCPYGYDGLYGSVSWAPKPGSSILS